MGPKLEQPLNFKQWKVCFGGFLYCWSLLPPGSAHEFIMMTDEQWCKSILQQPLMYNMTPRVSCRCSAQVRLGGTRWFGALGSRCTRPTHSSYMQWCCHGARWGCPARVVSWIVRGRSLRLCKKKKISWDGHGRLGWGCATLCRWMWWMVGAPKGPREREHLIKNHKTQRPLASDVGQILCFRESLVVGFEHSFVWVWSLGNQLDSCLQLMTRSIQYLPAEQLHQGGRPLPQENGATNSEKLCCFRG